MATIAPRRPVASPKPAPLALPDVYRMTVDEYERMADAGVLNDERIELIDGYLVKKMGKKPPHVWTVGSAHEHIIPMLPPGWFIRVEDPVRIPDFDEPEPDLAVVRGSRATYRQRHPEPADIALLVEVSDRTLPRDQGAKKAAYARGRIPVYWIVNLIDRQVEVHSGPTGRGYRTTRVYKPGQEVPVVIGGIKVGRIPVDSILP
jgi:Uma2 family endonuclease